MDGWMDEWMEGRRARSDGKRRCLLFPTVARSAHPLNLHPGGRYSALLQRPGACPPGTSVPGHQALERPVHASPGALEDSAAPPPVHTALSAAICSSPREPLRTQQRQAHHQRGPRSLAHDKGTWTNRAGETTQFLATGSEISLPLAPVAAAGSRRCVCLRGAACPTTHTGYNYKVGRRQELRANDGPIETSWRA